MVQVTHKKQRRSAVIGMVLGDGYIHKDGNLRITHGVKQKEYLNFKKDILQQNQVPDLLLKEFCNNGYPGCKVETRVRPMYKLLRKKMYKNGIKIISRQCLDWLDELGLAIWFMDDGSTSAKKRNGKIHSYELTMNTYCSKEENEIAICYFKDVWNIKWGLSKNKGSYRLRTGVREGRKFAEIIKPFFVPCMNYKIQPLV
jgi:hypothetical protein